MSVKPIKLFATQPHDCSYLEGHRATTLFVDPDEEITVELYTRLSDLGFRRSGAHLYKPHCGECDKCIPARVSCKHYRLSRSDKRVLRRNKDLSVRWLDSIETNECYALFEKYINQRHADGDMYPPSWEQYTDFLGAHCPLTRYMAAFDGDQLVMVAVHDELPDGQSAVYTFFAPELDDRSLGKFAILRLINEVQRANAEYLYLGYWIEGCRKMAYKQAYQPMEILQNNEWQQIIVKDNFAASTN